MIIQKVELYNFRQYYGKVSVDLTVPSSRNVILIGGQNGFGKTNFLISLVWCLYGKDLEFVDPLFKQEIRNPDKKYKTGYDAFLKESLNFMAKKEGQMSFCVSMTFTDIEYLSNHKLESIQITRGYNVQTEEETLTLKSLSSNDNLPSDKEDIKEFINESLIPIEAAKFVFFDAEKISEIADMSESDEQSILNDALNKILGLDLYLNLIKDLNSQIDELTLKSDLSPISIEEEIKNCDKEISLLEQDIERCKKERRANEKEIELIEKRQLIKESELTTLSKVGNMPLDREAIVQQIDDLNCLKEDLTSQFHKLSGMLPLAILTGKITEVLENIKIQRSNRAIYRYREDLSEKLELLYNKIFYNDNNQVAPLSEEVRKIYKRLVREKGMEVFSTEKQIIPLQFEHDIKESDIKLLARALNDIDFSIRDEFSRIQEDLYSTIESLESAKLELDTIDKGMNSTLAQNLLDEIEKYKTTISNLNYRNGGLAKEIEQFNTSIVKIKDERSRKLQKIKVNKKTQKKIDVYQRYIDTLSEFIDREKQLKQQSLEANIKELIFKIMHKLGNKTSDQIKVEVDIKPNNAGLSVSLLNEYQDEILKKNFSKGEKQIYISCLIKAILTESIQDFPIIIDTPLGRLDKNHIENILNRYYPVLAKQVILLSTDNEITPSRLKLIDRFIEKNTLFHLTMM